METPMTVEEIDARIPDVDKRLEELNQEWEGRQMPPAADDEWEALNAERDDLTTLRKELVVRINRLAEIAGNADHRDDPKPRLYVGARKTESDIYDLVSLRRQSQSPEHEVELLRDAAMRSVESSRFEAPGFSKEQIQGNVAKLIDGDQPNEQTGYAGGEIARRVLGTGSALYKRAFGKAISGKPLSSEEQRALTVVTTGGGYAIPYALDPTMIHVSNYSVNPYRAICRTETITGSNTWQGVTTTGVTAARIIEAGTASDNAPSFLQPSGQVSRVHCHVPFSYEVEGDIAGLHGEITSLFMDAKDDEEAVAFTTGNGTAPNPVGILGTSGLGTAAPPKVLCAGTAAFAIGDVDNAMNTLPPRWRPRSTWIANYGFYNRVRRAYTAGGETLTPNYGPGNVAGFTSNPPGGGTVGYQLLGRPAYEATGINTTNVLTSGTKLAVLGDFSRGMVIVDRVGMNVEVISNLLSGGTLPLGQRALYAWWRNTTVLAAPTAFVYLQTT